MILEIVITQVKAGQEEAFEAAFKEATKLIVSAKGFISNELQRCIETKGRYVHLVRWESVDDHIVGFRGSPEFQQFRALLTSYYESPSQMEHYEMVLKKSFMILEIAILKVNEGQETQYEAALWDAYPIIAASKGFVSFEFQRCVETQGRYVFLIKWETLEDHVTGFRESPAYQEWKARLHPFYSMSQVEHYEQVLLYPKSTLRRLSNRVIRKDVRR